VLASAKGYKTHKLEKGFIRSKLSKVEADYGSQAQQKIDPTLHLSSNMKLSNSRLILVLLSLLVSAASGFTIPTTAHHSRATSRATSALIVAAGPSVLERPVATPAVQAGPAKERVRQGSEAWEVRIYNDGLNTREHVSRSLVQVTGMSEMGAYQTMMQAHQNGIAVVGRWAYEVAEMYHDALRKNGIVCDLVPVDDE
jgi:ATP-dependent Clp protease adaptor protein ClpS